MLIWDIIRDWFVQYIFGGVTSKGNYFTGGFLGNFTNDDGAFYENIWMENAYIKIGATHIDTNSTIANYIGLGDWLSTTATLIVIIAICFGLFMLVRYFFRMFSGLLTLR